MRNINLKVLFTTLTLSSTFLAQSQNNYYPTAGNVGFGTTSSTSNFNLQLHGTTDYSVTLPPDRFGNPGATIPYGKTSRLGMTNTTTGFTSADGMLLRMSGLNFTMENLEKKDIYITTNTLGLTFDGTANRAWFGAVPGTNTATTYGQLNISTADNGFYIKTTAAGAYGLSFVSNALTDNAIQVMGTTGTTRNFSVKANGEVYARKYTTTLGTIPDYVFQSGYQLMPLSELRTYVTTNSHLPNVPSAKEYEETGVDLGELNRLLLEKTEELTLYILQLEERLRILEEEKK